MRQIGLPAASFLAALLATASSGDAMPPFAEAYAANCTVCHTEVPTLNAFGRYVQRTGYSALDHRVLKAALPLWIGVNPTYDSQNPGPQKLQTGNVAIHAIGFVAGDWTYHIQQWITQNNASGGVDTAWVAYNNLLHRDGHMFLGKILSPAPSPYSQWADLAPFATPQITVGEHAYQNTNRWGGKFAYVHKSLDAEMAWLGSGEDLGGTSNFSNSIDKTFQWKLADANPKRPLEFGVFGSRGSFPLPEGGTDQYYSTSAYLQRDPHRAIPGMFFVYQTAFDANPGGGASAAASNAATLELYQNLFADRAIVGARKEFTNDGLGTQLQSGNFDFEYHLARFVHAYVEMYLAQSSKPGYRYMIWWTTPLSRPLNP